MVVTAAAGVRQRPSLAEALEALRRNDGSFEAMVRTAAVMRAKRDLALQCAESLRRVAPFGPCITICCGAQFTHSERALTQSMRDDESYRVVDAMWWPCIKVLVDPQTPRREEAVWVLQRAADITLRVWGVAEDVSIRVFVGVPADVPMFVRD